MITSLPLIIGVNSYVEICVGIVREWRMCEERLVEGSSELDICGEEGYEGDICRERQKEVEIGKEVYGMGGREVER